MERCPKIRRNYSVRSSPNSDRDQIEGVENVESTPNFEASHMHRIHSALGALSLSLAALAAPAAAHAQARVAEQKFVGPPAPEAVLAGAPAEAPPADKKAAKLSPMESALYAAAKDLRVASLKGMLVHPTSGARISSGASEAVLAVMSKPTAESEAQLRNALMMSGNSRDDVNDMMLELPELMSEPSSDHVRSARKHFEEFMHRSNESFRVNPPAEAMAVDAALARLSSAEAGFRDDERARKEEQKARKAQPKKNDKKAAAEAKKRADAEKKAAEKRAAEEKKAAEKRAAEEKKAAEKAAKENRKSPSK